MRSASFWRHFHLCSRYGYSMKPVCHQYGICIDAIRNDDKDDKDVEGKQL